LTPPTFSSNEIYGSTLSDAAFWSPYGLAALERSGFDEVPLECGFVGTYPTLLGGTLVVKLFGHFGDWGRSFSTELSANRAIAADRTIRAAPVLASGRLFPGAQADWPYLIMQRLPGLAWRDTVLPPDIRQRLAGCLGRQLRAVHDTQVTDPAALHPDWLVGQAHNATRRHRDWGSLPTRLIDQIDDFVSDYHPTATCLVHGDVTEDHIFIERGEIIGLIDWGDAMITDPFYDLGALHLGAFRGDISLLRRFTDGYGWQVDDGFARQAMQVALMHQFDLFGQIADQVQTTRTLTELAEVLWAVHPG
jgi:aminoglycoside phosphotransferase (APT) family kinase protein